MNDLLITSSNAQFLLDIGTSKINHKLMNINIQNACEKACQAIAPAWPLDRAIAVNPHWSRINLSVMSATVQ